MHGHSMAAKRPRLRRPNVIVTKQVASPLLRGLAAYWKLDEAAGGTRFDSVGGHHLSDTNDVAQAAGKIGYAAEFLSASNHYLSNADAALRLSTFTVAGWSANNDVTQTNATFASRFNTLDACWLIKHKSTGIVRFGWTDDGDHAATATADTPNMGFVNGEWFFWCLRAGPTMVYCRVNTTDVTPAATKTPIYTGMSPFLLGGQLENDDLQPAAAFEGRVDEVGYWNRVLSATEVDLLYNGGAGRAYPFY